MGWVIFGHVFEVMVFFNGLVALIVHVILDVLDKSLMVGSITSWALGTSTVADWAMTNEHFNNQNNTKCITALYQVDLSFVLIQDVEGMELEAHPI